MEIPQVNLTIEGAVEPISKWNTYAKTLLYWTYEGVDYSIDGTGGEDCVNFLGLGQRLIETFFACGLACLAMYVAYPRLKLPQALAEDRNSKMKRFLSVLLTLTFGVELGYKLATKQFIWIFNPCHLETIAQIFLLAAPSNKYVTTVFRLHMYAFHGATLAMLLPVTNTRLLPFETEVYYVQHILMLLVPYFLMRERGPYLTEPISDIWWPLMALGILYFWHFGPLHYIAYLSQVNLNNMLCPAISDPFYGPRYRWWAMGHQVLMIPLHAKVYTYVANLLLPSSTQDSHRGRGDSLGSNGHAKMN
ncbi:transmembrane protein 164 [Lingula anatina]|uniref:Transmembrane protein 164 n=1 Tax=Lingula anatina TaxID=7574 RepID=A0A1S3I6H1_LINAN|nr:transmembrane protein 164 [Lingula anatina]XP_013393803.1 transmembrane protein 164 [Lingula anatina]|eukprot:XP_013393802.1 transmembrane protein 164 [Lingula anatina]